METENVPDDGMKALMIGHLRIRDVTTGEVLLNQRDVAHPELKGEQDASD